MAFSKILVPLSGQLDGTETLELAIAAARLIRGHVEALYIQPAPVEVLRPADGSEPAGGAQDETVRIEQEAAASLDAAYRVFRNWAVRRGVGLGTPSALHAWDVSASWREYIGAPAQVIAEFGRYSDLIVLQQPGSEVDDPRYVEIGALLLATGCPVLLVPPKARSDFGRNVVVAWDGSRAGLNALTGVLPLIERFPRIVVLTVDTTGTDPMLEADLLRLLTYTSVRPERRVLQPSNLTTGERLLHESRRDGADLLVLGVAAHPQSHGDTLGCTNRHVVQTAEMLVLLGQ